MPKKLFLFFTSLLLVSMLLAGCGGPENGNKQELQYTDDAKVLNIIAGSEQQTILEQIVTPWCKSKGFTCNFVLKGSVDQSFLLKQGGGAYDVFWFASSVFEQIGDEKNVLKDVQPMFITPLVYAGWKSEMQKLGFVGRDDISVSEILSAVESHKTTAWLTNPSQSNSGATVFFGFLNYFAGNKAGVPLSKQQLESQPVQEGITKFIRSMDQTPPSTGTLMNNCIANKEKCRTLFTYEALAIENNKQLVSKGQEPLYVVYPKESLAIADAPMGFLPHGGSANSAKEQTFRQLQQYLLSADVQHKLLQLGRRPAGGGGLSLTNADSATFNPDWGIKATLHQQAITYPAPDVINQALDNYQTSYRRPVHTVYCLDGSGSMDGNGGWDQLKESSELLFDQTKAREYLLQTHPQDLTSVMIFNNTIAAGPDGSWTVEGNDPQKMRGLYNNIQSRGPDGGTNMYVCLQKAVELFNQQPNENRKRLIIVMTDGQSEQGNNANQIIQSIASLGVPVISVAFGSDADLTQLKEVSTATHGSVTQKDNMTEAMREATGYK
ncbi:VWA domain-containing protein [Ktedonospora formicarum]|uniref:VWA domain-containing protein n=1 Tax=Ktedonospora formicarum TaxID=2778364 RepID=A0A8J3HVW7_9CHLR|nr:VWA domain-containing protein [Ktedonospora formicarum]GHO41970.1 VWA domain-containing protein [Ktedonospora formicarum]